MLNNKQEIAVFEIFQTRNNKKYYFVGLKIFQSYYNITQVHPGLYDYQCQEQAGGNFINYFLACNFLKQFKLVLTR